MEPLHCTVKKHPRKSHQVLISFKHIVNLIKSFRNYQRNCKTRKERLHMWKPLQQHFFAIVIPTQDGIYDSIAECHCRFPWLDMVVISYWLTFSNLVSCVSFSLFNVIFIFNEELGSQYSYNEMFDLTIDSVTQIEVGRPFETMPQVSPTIITNR